MLMGKSANRVRRHTPGHVNARIENQSQADVMYYAQFPDEIDARLRELEREWDIERWLQLNSAAISLLGLVLGLTRTRRWLILPAVIQSFFLEHGLQGWCPPIPILRRLGIRTQSEIQTERHALKALRGEMGLDYVLKLDDFTI